MDREIKFRGKDIETNEWRYGYLQHNYNKKYSRILSPLSIDTFYFPIQEFRVAGNTVGQYTEVSDKNNKEIYDKDIVKAPFLDPIFDCIIDNAFVNAVITFNNGSWVVDYGNRDKKVYLCELCDKIEVIGNLIDNKELLEEK